MLSCSRLLACICIVLATAGVFGYDPQAWKTLHDKMLKKAAAEKVVKPSLARQDNTASDTTSAAAASLADILNNRRKAAAAAAVKPQDPPSATGDLLDTIPIQLQDGAETYLVEFKLFSGSDPLSQVKVFCKEYNLLGDYCTALSDRAETVYANAVQIKEPASLAVVNLTDVLNKGRKPMVDSPAPLLIETIPIRLEYKDEIVDIEFQLFDSPEPSAQARSFCNQYDLSEAYCEALTERAQDVFRSALSGQTEPAVTQSATAPEPAAPAAPVSSVASKLADILSKRRKPSSSKVPPTLGNVIDIIPIQMEYEDEIVDIEFKVYDNADPSEQAKAFCLEHDLVDEYCAALTARAEFLYSNNK